MILEKILCRNKMGYKAICGCDVCGSTFERKYGKVKQRSVHFCSGACKGKWISKNHSGVNHYSYGKHLSEETKKKIGLAQTGPLSSCWKGGRTLRDGYIYIYSPNHPNLDSKGYVAEHRLIIEKILKRYLTKNEIVHHLNGIRNDNRPENLCVVNSKNHEKHTLVKIMRKRIVELENLLSGRVKG